MNFYGDINYYDDNLLAYPQANNLWSNYSQKQKGAILQRLSKEIDRKVSWVGKKLYIGQPLEFPKDFEGTWVYDDLTDYYYKNHKKIPDELLECMLEYLAEFLAPDKFKDLWKKGVNSINDSVISVSLSKPNDGEIKTVSGLINKYLFYFTNLGYTQYRRSLGVL